MLLLLLLLLLQLAVPPTQTRVHVCRYLRWLQAGVFQPIFRTHICEGGQNWVWTYANFPLMQGAFHLRNALVPYIYTASFTACVRGGCAVVRAGGPSAWRAGPPLCVCMCMCVCVCVYVFVCVCACMCV